MGDPKGSRLVILWGDSHARQLLPMLDRWGKSAGVAILPRVRGGCRPAIQGADIPDFSRFSDARTCAWFRNAVLDQIAQIARSRPATLMVASRWPDSKVPDSFDGSGAAMGARIETAAAAIAAKARAMSVPLVLMLDTPLMPAPAPRCAARRRLGDCGTTRAEAEAQRSEATAALRRLAARDPAVRLIDPFPALCTARACPAGDGVSLWYSDNQHLSLAGSLYLGGRLKPQLDALLSEAR